MEVFFAALLGAPWTAIGAGIVSFMAGSVSVLNSGATLWQSLQKLKAQRDPGVIGRLVSDKTPDGELLKLAAELESDVRPLAVALIKRQLMAYVALGLGVSAILALAVGFLWRVASQVAFAISQPILSGLVLIWVSALILRFANARAWIADPNTVFREASTKARKLSASKWPSIQDALATTMSAWRVTNSRIATAEEVRLVEQFVLTDMLIRNLWAHTLTVKLMNLRLGLAPALREQVGEVLAEGIVANRDAFRQNAGGDPRSEEWRERNREALAFVFDRLGLGPEFTRDLAGGFLENDFYNLAATGNLLFLKQLLSQHPMFRPLV